MEDRFRLVHLDSEAICVTADAFSIHAGAVTVGTGLCGLYGAARFCVIMRGCV